MYMNSAGDDVCDFFRGNMYMNFVWGGFLFKRDSLRGEYVYEFCRGNMYLNFRGNMYMNFPAKINY